MLFKFNVSNVVITNTNAHGVITESTTLKTDSINFEAEATAEEVIKVMEATVELISKKQKKNMVDRYHVFITERWTSNNDPIHDKWIYDRRDHKYIHQDGYGNKAICGKAKYMQISRAYYGEKRIEGLDVIESYDTDF